MTPNPVEPKLPRSVFEHDPTRLYAFPPNRETLGGTAYFLANPAGNLLIDSPAWTPENQNFLSEKGVRWLLVTHRGNMGKKIPQIQKALGCEVVVQEQEAYLLPDAKITSFQHGYEFDGGHRAIWTAGHSPGTACLYSPIAGGVLFTGRHLLPDRQGMPLPLRTSKTFHWPRQIHNVQALLDRFSAQTLQHICPGASLGFLRGNYTISDAYQKLAQLDLAQLINLNSVL